MVQESVQSQEQLVRALLDGLATGAIAVLGSALAEEVEMQIPFQAPGYFAGGSGREEVLRFFRALPKIFDPFKVVVDRCMPLADGTGLVALYRTEAKVRATGRPYENTYVGLFEFSGDQIVNWTEFHNPLVMLEAFRPAT